MEKEKEHNMKTKTNNKPKSSRVQQICQNFLVHADSGLAHRLQEEEFAVHFDRNRTHRRETRLGVQAARHIEEEEKKIFFEKKLDLYQQKHKIEENDIELARQLQEKIEPTSNLRDRKSDHYSFDDQNHYDEINQSQTMDDTSSDEQLARILQEEEQLLASASHRSSFTTKYA